MMDEEMPISSLLLLTTTAAENKTFVDENEASLLDILFNSDDGILSGVDEFVNNIGFELCLDDDPFKDICSLSSADSADDLMMMTTSIDEMTQDTGALDDHNYSYAQQLPPMVSDFAEILDQLWANSVGEELSVDLTENGISSQFSPLSDDSSNVSSGFCQSFPDPDNPPSPPSPPSSSTSPERVANPTSADDSGGLFNFEGLDFNVPEDFAINFDDNNISDEDDFEFQELTKKKTITVSRSADTLPYAVKGFGEYDISNLQLTEEERMMLDAEGAVVPTSLPLTKSEERLLKKVRRKIRNKKSAHVSRQKKKEYINGLESRVQNCTSQNFNLQKRVLDLEEQNMSLLDQLKKLQTLVKKSAKSTQAGTCVMVLVLSFMFLVFPSVNPFRSNGSNLPSHAVGHSYTPNGVMSRTLMNLNNADDDGVVGYTLNGESNEIYSSQTQDIVKDYSSHDDINDDDLMRESLEPAMDTDVEIEPADNETFTTSDSDITSGTDDTEYIVTSTVATNTTSHNNQ